MFDLIIIGAGPAGIAAAFEAKKAGLKYLVLEKGLIGNTIYQYPVGLTVFSTTNELEFEEGGLKPAREKPTREELLSYYVRFVLDNDLNVLTEEKVHLVGKIEHVDSVAANHMAFRVVTEKSFYDCTNVLFAIGAMDYPRKLGVPGEDLPKVHHLFVEPYAYIRKDALVVGGGNSAAEAALFLSEEGARTVLAIWREDWENRDPKAGAMKHWVRMPLEKEVTAGRLRVILYKEILTITEDDVTLLTEEGEQLTIPNEVTFVLIGSDADLTLLKKLGVKTEPGKLTEMPVYDPETFETNVRGVYVVGHFTHARHIKAAIDVPRAIVPHIARSLRVPAGKD